MMWERIEEKRGGGVGKRERGRGEVGGGGEGFTLRVDFEGNAPSSTRDLVSRS